jgi:hypothetical protein
MNGRFSMMARIAAAATLAAGISGIARADSSTNPLNGDSYFYFKNAQAAASRAPSEWRQTHPSGLSERELQALSSESPVWQLPTKSDANPVATTDEGSFTISAAKR